MPKFDASTPEICLTEKGIPYYLQVDPGSYSERFARDGNQITAKLICRWEDAADFRDEVLGSTLYTRGTEASPGPGIYQRSLPLLCPYSESLYAIDMALTDYGRFTADDLDFGEVDAGLGGKTPFILDESNWPNFGHAVYSVTFANLPYPNALKDDELPTQDETAEKQKPAEMFRCLRREAPVNVRELRRPDYGYEVDEPGDNPQQIPVVGFIPSIEKNVEYTQYQVPWEHIPRSIMESTEVLLHVNDDIFDDYAINTLLYIGTKNIEQPYRGPDGRLYFDPVIMFRWNPFGWNKILLPRRNPPDNIKYVRAKGVTPTKRLYEETDQFYKLFQPRRF